MHFLPDNNMGKYWHCFYIEESVLREFGILVSLILLSVVCFREGVLA